MALVKLVGEPIKRREDPRLITGGSTYVDDVRLPGMLYLVIVRSPYAHARIRGIDTRAATAHPTVARVLTGEEVAARIKPLPVLGMKGLKIPKRYPLAVGKVRYMGEAVAAVVATDRYAARDAADLIEVDYEPLPVVVDVEKAAGEGAPLLHEELGDNIAYVMKQEGGEVDRAFQQAAVTVSQRLIQQRLAPSAMEPRGVVAHYEKGRGTLTVWVSTQFPHFLRTYLADILNLPEHRVRVIAPEVGGGFGSKMDVYPDEVLTAFLSLDLGRPVKWIEERRENLMATTHGRARLDTVELAADKDGRVQAIKIHVLADMGAYLQLLTALIPPSTATMAVGPYQIPNARVEIVGVFTNTTPTSAYRGAGRPEATYLLERAMDILAHKLNLDPAEVRRRNFIPPDAFPYTAPTGAVYDSGNYQPALEKALEMVNYQALRDEQKRRRAEGRFLGIGLSSYVEICGMGPSSAMPFAAWESSTVRVEPSGKVTVLTGTSPHGQGQETSFAQLAAEELGVPLDDVVVLHGDTAQVPYGVGTFGSRATVVGGTALLLALGSVKEKAKRLAAHLLEASVEDVVYEGGKLYVRGMPAKALTLQEVAKVAYRAARLPKEIEPGLEATRRFEPPNFTYPFGTHVAVVEVDPETGQIKLVRYVAVDDCGKVINPLLVDGQVHGGIAQGVAQALLEEVVYDENGQLLTGSLMDYALPRADTFPFFETARTETLSPANPLGVKGIGEAGTIGATPAVVNAVVDALSPLGITHLDMPLKPEKIWRFLQVRQQSR